MADCVLNRFELSQYSQLRSQVMQLDEDIKDIENELAELNQCYMNINPVITGMPNGNEKRDKIADFIIKLEKDKNRLNAALDSLILERNTIKYRMYKIWAAVNQIPNKQLRDIIKWHFIDGHKVGKIAKENFMTPNAIQKRLNRFFRCGAKNRRG